MKKAIRLVVLILAGIVVLICVLFGYSDRSVDELSSKYAQAPSDFVELMGMNVHFRDEGNPQDSMPVVLLHGTGSSLHTFDSWTEILKESNRVIRMDLPGFGLTGPFPTRNYSMDRYVEFVASFLSARNITHCVLAGNSLGGHIAWQFTLRHPEMVDKLILIDAAGFPLKSTSVPMAFKMARTPALNKILTFITPQFVVQSSVYNVYADKSKVTDELVDRYFDLSLRAGNRQALIDRMQMPFDENEVEQITTISQPTLILWGAEDGLIPTESAYRFQNYLPNDTLVILKNSGHVPMEENPEESLEAVLAFIGSK